MRVEIERKFLMANDSWRNFIQRSSLLKQGYISRGENSKTTVRVRLADHCGFLTLKGKSNGFARDEFEYEIPENDALNMLQQFCEKPLIEKCRYFIEYGGFTWEIDEFTGENQGLILAEIELPDENTSFEKPEWIGREVSHLARYYNSMISRYPYQGWQEWEKAGKDSPDQD